jgi:hypothetical protein
MTRQSATGWIRRGSPIFRCGQGQSVSSSAGDMPAPVTPIRSPRHKIQRRRSIPSRPRGCSLPTAAGDQIMVAEGTTYSPVIGSFNGRRGFSALYPTCIRSYDPADPTNTAKYGRATTNRPTFTAPGVLHALGDGGSTAPTQPAASLRFRGWRSFQARARWGSTSFAAIQGPTISFSSRTAYSHRAISASPSEARKQAAHSASSSATARFTGATAPRSPGSTSTGQSASRLKITSCGTAAGRLAEVVTMIRRLAAQAHLTTPITSRRTASGPSFGGT